MSNKGKKNTATATTETITKTPIQGTAVGHLGIRINGIDLDLTSYVPEGSLADTSEILSEIIRRTDLGKVSTYYHAGRIAVLAIGKYSEDGSKTPAEAEKIVDGRLAESGVGNVNLRYLLKWYHVAQQVCGECPNGIVDEIFRQLLPCLSNLKVENWFAPVMDDDLTSRLSELCREGKLTGSYGNCIVAAKKALADSAIAKRVALAKEMTRLTELSQKAPTLQAKSKAESELKKVEQQLGKIEEKAKKATISLESAEISQGLRGKDDRSVPVPPGVGTGEKGCTIDAALSIMTELSKDDDKEQMRFEICRLLIANNRSVASAVFFHVLKQFPSIKDNAPKGRLSGLVESHD
ncbi:MAG: hypothetical protein HC888_00710 [Candidatus Competibacteraceae bacterium]|nr:hypothetical protein [Candidatus Competibacteraceae bacterium]